jgi:mannose-6-phosphate isomerase-like protein (cupin superfamily)
MDLFSKQILSELFPEETIPLAATARKVKQQPPEHPDHWSSPVLLERAAYLRQLARHGDGSASETLREYPQHCAMLLVRSRDGGAEAHENFADVFYVLDGRAMLVTGGTIADASRIAPGEIRGGSVEGGARQELRAGDVAHVPAGVPHQMLVSGEQTISCLVVKIQENP